MSNMDAASQETQQQQDKGEKSFLSQQEREQVKRYLSFAEEFPPEFGAWLLDYVGTAAQIQKYQVQGLPLLNTQVGQALTDVQTALDGVESVVAALANIGTTYSDSQAAQVAVSNGPNASPVVSVPAGTYFCILVAQAQITDGAGSLTMQLYGPAGAFGSAALWSASVVPSDIGTILSIGSVTVSGTSNDIKVTYTKAGAGNRWASNRFLIALRTA